jgi:glyoxylase-like metal-dependent hydrolase (beta-lactamase superfamily II)
MKIKIFTLNVFAVNTYLLWDETSKEAMIIDPGCSLPEEEAEISSFIAQENLNLKYLLNTHCHIDHIIGNAFIKENYDVKFFAPKGEIPLLQSAVEQAEYFGVQMKPSPLPDLDITESLVLKFGPLQIKFISTPGHTSDGYSIYFESEKICFTGDTLFFEGIGRTDLWGGNYSALIKSINEKLFLLPEDVKIYPGHGEESTIGYEKNNNPFLN